MEYVLVYCPTRSGCTYIFFAASSLTCTLQGHLMLFALFKSRPHFKTKSGGGGENCPSHDHSWSEALGPVAWYFIARVLLSATGWPAKERCAWSMRIQNRGKEKLPSAMRGSAGSWNNSAVFNCRRRRGKKRGEPERGWGPAAHSPHDIHFLSKGPTQHRGGRGGTAAHVANSNWGTGEFRLLYIFLDLLCIYFNWGVAFCGPLFNYPSAIRVSSHCIWSIPLRRRSHKYSFVGYEKFLFCAEYNSTHYIQVNTSHDHVTLRYI